MSRIIPQIESQPEGHVLYYLRHKQDQVTCQELDKIECQPEMHIIFRFT